MSRKRVVAAGVTSAVVLGLCGVALHPYLRGRIERMASARLGVRVHVDSLSLGFSSVTLRRVSVGSDDAELSGTVGSVRVTPGPLSLAFGGTAALSSIRADDIELRVSRSGLERLRGGRAPSESARTEGVQRELSLSVHDVHLLVEDEYGELGQFSVASAELDPHGVLAADGAALDIGQSDGGELVVTGVSLRAQSGLSPRLLRLDVASGYVIGVRPGEPGVRTWARVAPILALLGGEPPVDTENSDGAPADAGVVTDATLRSAPDSGTADSPGIETSPPEVIDAGADGGAAPTGHTWVSPERLAGASSMVAGAEVSLSDFEIRIHGQGTDRVVVRDLVSRFAFRSEGLHLDGHGVADTGGAMRWDLTLNPAQARGEGSISAAELPLDLLSPLVPLIPLTHPERGRLSFSLNLRSIGDDVAIDGDLTLRNAELTSLAVAAHPVGGLSIAAEGRARWSPTRRRLSLEEVRLSQGRAVVRLSGTLEAPADHYAANVVASLLPTDCGDALGAIPRDLLDDVADFALEGRIAGRIGLELDSRRLADTQLRVHVADGCRFVSVPGVADLRRVGGPFVHRVQEPDGTTFEMTTGPGTAVWTPISSISPFLVHAVVAHEDAAFFRHSGFAPWAIRDALVRDLEAGRYVTGASTITMQLAKNLFLQREKTLARKAQEVILTWWLEAARSKQEILELYLNLIEYGPSIYGIRAASEHYFGREPVDLSLAESAFLASILPSPKLFHSQYVAGALTHSMRSRMEHLLERMAERGRIDQAALEDGRAEVADFHFARPGQSITHVAAGGYAPLSWTTDLDEASSFDDSEDADSLQSEQDGEGDAASTW